MIEYDKERQEHLEPGLFEPTADDNLLTREIPVEIKVCLFVLFSYFVTSVGCFGVQCAHSNAIVWENLGLSGNFVACSEEHQLW